ncbi:hypothetical protein [Vibrio sp. TRT 17S01]|uniref:hypothetical protein n=1 Tax=Vibrio sp. TRT 17S01 TaxID=3418505 RepID=UPI003CE737EA
MKQHDHEKPFVHKGGNVQIEISGTGSAQLQVATGADSQTWLNCGAALSSGVYADLFKPGEYRFQINNATVVTR